MYPLYFHLILEWLFSCCRVPCWQQFSIRILKLLLAGCGWEGCCQPRCHFREGIRPPSVPICNPTSVSLSAHQVSLCLTKSVSSIQVLPSILGHDLFTPRYWLMLVGLPHCAPSPGSELPFPRVPHLWSYGPSDSTLNLSTRVQFASTVEFLKCYAMFYTFGFLGEVHHTAPK